MQKLFFFFLLSPLILFGQEKGATQIIIKNNFSAKENHALIMNKLLDSGFMVASKDDSYYYIKTEPRNLGKTSILYYLYLRSKDNEIIVTGQSKFSLDDYADIVNKGMNGSINIKAFKEMQLFADKLKSN